jgi:hypothetical protein
MYQRGKKVVSASSGKTIRSQSVSTALSSSAIMRATTASRLSARWIGPIWAAATRTLRMIL